MSGGSEYIGVEFSNVMAMRRYGLKFFPGRLMAIPLGWRYLVDALRLKVGDFEYLKDEFITLIANLYSLVLQK